jgi:transketolase
MPKYLRLDGKPLPPIYENINDLDLERGFYELLNPPTGREKVCLVSTGFMTHRALKAAENLQNTGVVDVFLLKPLNEKLLFETLKKYEYIITIEEAFINSGGLDSLISKILRDNQSNIKLKGLGFNDEYVFSLGNREHLHKLNNLDEESIIKVIQNDN